MASAITAGLDAASSETRDLLGRALDRDLSVREVTKAFGLHCDLGAGVPSVMHNLKTAAGYTEAIRRNLYAGGDNCGRAIVLGAVCGAQFGMDGANGIPDEWLDRVKCKDEIEALVDRLFESP